MADKVLEIKNKIENYLKPLGMEIAFFKVDWYNNKVSPAFHLNYKDNTICAVILTCPSFFENAFIPYIKTNSLVNNKDLVDACISSHIEKVIQQFSNFKPICKYDYELLPNRRPQVLVQTAAHVSGAAYYYQMKNLNNDKKLYGVCIHPKFGGWFAIRGIIVFTELQYEGLVYKPPVNCIPEPDKQLELLKRFNHNWKDASYRDIIEVKEKYSSLQREYFETLPKNRGAIIKKLLDI